MAIELYLIRHGETDMNTRPHLLCGRSNDAPLTQKGVKQAMDLGVRMVLNNIVPTKVYSSPADRAIHTTDLILEAMQLDMSPIIDDALLEIDQGDWTGRLRAEVYSPAVMEEMSRLGKDFKAPNGESIHEGGVRLSGWADLLLASDDDSEPQRIFVITHGVAIRSFVATLRNWTRDETLQAATHNTSATLLTSLQGKWKVEYVGKML